MKALKAEVLRWKFLAKCETERAEKAEADFTELQKATAWYFECSELSTWAINRDDVDCNDYHRDDEPCPWCDSYDQIDTELTCAEAELKRLAGDDN